MTKFNPFWRRQYQRRRPEPTISIYRTMTEEQMRLAANINRAISIKDYQINELRAMKKFANQYPETFRLQLDAASHHVSMPDCESSLKVVDCAFDLLMSQRDELLDQLKHLDEHKQ